MPAIVPKRMLRAFLLSLSIATSAMSADVLLPPPEIGPAPGFFPPRAAAAGGLFLVAWIDDRGICAARISSDGVLLDRLPIVVAPKTDPVTNLIAVGNDDHWTLFWLGPALRAARIGLDGHIIDAAPRTFGERDFEFDVVRDGSGFALLSFGGLSLIDGGLDSVRDFRFLLPGDFFAGARGGHVAANGDGYLVAVANRLTFFDAAGGVRKGLTLPGGVDSCRLASVGGVYMAAWTTKDGTELMAAAFDAAGRTLVPPRTISAPQDGPPAAITFEMAANGAGYTIVSAEIGTTQRMRAMRFAPNGSQIETLAVDRPRRLAVLALASEGTSNLLVTTTAPPSWSFTEGWVFRSLPSLPAEPQIPAIVFRAHLLPAAAIAANGDGFAAAWLETITPPSNLGIGETAVHFIASGAAPVELARGDFTGRETLALASNGDSTLVAWTSSGDRLRARLLNRGGNSRDASLPAPAVKKLVSAWTGRVYLLLWLDDAGAIHSAAVSPFGDAGDVREVATGLLTVSPDNLELACNGHGCVVSGRFWTPAALLNLLTARFDESGNAVAPAHTTRLVGNRMPTLPFFDREGHAFVLFGTESRISGVSVVALADDGAIASSETTLTANPLEDPLLGTESGFYSVRWTLSGWRLMWTWMTLTPEPAIAGAADLGPGCQVLNVAARGGYAAALLRLGRSSLAIREIPPPSTRRRHAT